MARTALETVTRYIEEIWNGGHDALIPELCADPVVRHDPNALTSLSHAEQRARIRHNHDDLRPFFTWEVLAGDHELITLVWNVTGRDPAWRLCGIEIFRVIEGRITDVWNLPYAEGRWGQTRTLAGLIGDGPPTPLAIQGVELSGDGVEVTAPVDAVHIARWIAQLLGSPVSRAQGGGVWRHDFDGGQIALPLGLLVVDADGPTIRLPRVDAERASLELSQNGLVNATIRLVGAAEPAPETLPAMPAGKVVRLSRTCGTLERGGTVIGTVVDASVAFGRQGMDAGGRVLIRFADGQSAETAAGGGQLTLGWEEGDASLIFTAEARLEQVSQGFGDEVGREARFAWRAPGLRATLTNREPA